MKQGVYIYICVLEINIAELKHVQFVVIPFWCLLLSELEHYCLKGTD